MAQPDSDDFVVSRPERALWTTALELLFNALPTGARADYVARIVAGAVTGEIDLTGLFVAKQRNELAGVVWAQPQPGRVATLWPPAIRQTGCEACADSLLRSALQHIAATDMRLAQTLLALDSPQALWLARHGFEHLADLLYMVCLPESFPTALPAMELAFDAASSAPPARLTEIVEATYEGTLDCPRLNGVRQIDDVLAGYRTCGTHRPAHWMIARSGARDVGCLLLADYPESDQCEILYMGLIPTLRQQGHGAALVRCAQWQARQAGRARLVVAVDAANDPAVAAYARAGFITWERRRAWIRIFPDGGAGI